MNTSSYVLIGVGVLAGVCILVAVIGVLLNQSGVVNLAGNPTATAPRAIATGTSSPTSPMPTLAGTRPVTAPPPTALPNTPTPILALAPTLVPSAPTPLVIQPPPTPASGVKVLGETWETDGVELNLINIDIRDSASYDDAAVRAWFSFFNKTGQRILVEINWAQIYLEDGKGNRYVEYYGAKTDSIWVDAGQRYDFNRYYSRTAGLKSRVPTDAKFVTVVVDRFSRVTNARWRYDINPQLVAVPAPPASSVKQVGTGWESNGIQLTVTNIDVRATSNEDAAFRVFYKVSNRTNQRTLLEFDYTEFYVTDSFGVRFNDFYGGGYETQWIDPGKDLEFSRYYSTRADTQSRISPGAAYVLVNVRRFSRIQSAIWQFNIVR